MMFVSDLYFYNTEKEKERLKEQIRESYINGYNEGLNILDGIIVQALDNSDNKDESMTLRWVLDEISKMIIQ